MQMKRFLFAGGLALSLGLSAQAESAKPAEQPPPADFHVAVSGKDSAPGTRAKPFATIQRARDAVRGRSKSTDIKPGSSDLNSVPITVAVDQPIRAWKNPGDVELIYLNNNDASRKRVGAIEETAQTLTLPPAHQWPWAISAQAPGFPGAAMACCLV